MSVVSGIVSEQYDMIRCDMFLSSVSGLTRSKAQNIIDDGLFLINGTSVKKNYKVKAGDKYEYSEEKTVYSDVEPQDIDIEIIYEDSYLAVVNKPKGMVVHPAAGNYDGTMVNALLYKLKALSTLGGNIRPGIVHRIDKNTTGLLVVAKNDDVHLKLAKMIEIHDFQRVYYGIVIGTPKELMGTIDAPIGRSTKDRKKMAVTAVNSKNAVTHYEVIKSYGAYSLVKFKLETGRTHQIRVHCAYIGHPILGDDVYGGERKEFPDLIGQCLHAKILGFVHPITGEQMYFESDLPQYFAQLINKIENKYGGKI